MTKAHPHRQVNVHLDTVDDADVIERIEAQPSMVGYVRELVRRDIHDERLDFVASKTSELLAENAKLREEVCHLKKGDALHVLTDQEFAEQQKNEREMRASIKALDDDNAKLRELVADMYAVISRNNSWWDWARKDTRRFADRIRELGVEVEP